MLTTESRAATPASLVMTFVRHPTDNSVMANRPRLLRCSRAGRFSNLSRALDTHGAAGFSQGPPLRCKKAPPQ
jgi:hypothetical protein